MSPLHIKRLNPLLVMYVATFSQFLISFYWLKLFYMQMFYMYVVKSTVFSFMIDTINIVHGKLFSCPRLCK